MTAGQPSRASHGAFPGGVGAHGTTVYVQAPNDFGIQTLLSNLARFDAILAFTTDGNYMKIDDKGPLFIVLSYDDMEEVRIALCYTRFVWQIYGVEIE